MSTVHEALAELADLAGVSLAGFDDDQLNQIALRITQECGDEPEFTCIGKIADEVRFGSRRAGGSDDGHGEPAGAVDSVPTSLATPPRSDYCPVCTPIKVPYPSGWWIVHSKFCPDQPGAKIRRYGHPAGTAKATTRLVKAHNAEDARSTVVPLRGYRESCSKCGAPSRGAYCRDCRALLNLVKP